MGKKHLLEGHELIIGDDIPPPDFNGFTISEEDFMKMQETGALKVTEVRDKSRSDRGKHQTRRRRLNKLSKRSRQKNRR